MTKGMLLLLPEAFPPTPSQPPLGDGVVAVAHWVVAFVIPGGLHTTTSTVGDGVVGTNPLEWRNVESV